MLSRRKKRDKLPDSPSGIDPAALGDDAGRRHARRGRRVPGDAQALELAPSWKPDRPGHVRVMGDPGPPEADDA